MGHPNKAMAIHDYTIPLVHFVLFKRVSFQWMDMDGWIAGRNATWKMNT